MTKNAKQILKIVNDSRDHLTAEQIYLRLRESGEKTVLATVYNNLSRLCEQGLVRRVCVEGSPDRYDRTVRHDHLVCQRCGRLSDITLEDMTARLEQETGMEILSYDLKINYICPECRRKEAADGTEK